MRISGEQISTCWTSHRVLFQRLGMREKFYFFWTFWETAQAIENKEQRLEYLEAVIRHWIGDEEKELSPLVNALMVQTKFTLDRSQEISDSASERWKKWWAPKWNQNAKKNWEIISKQPNSSKNKQEQTKTSEEEVEVEEEVEDIMCDTHSEVDLKENKIRQTTATIKAERIWKLVLRHWNEKLWRNELRNAELTQRSYALDGVDLQQIDSLIDRYKWYKEKIDEKWLQGLFFFNLNEWILSDFLKNINRFEWDFDSVTWKLAKKDCTKQAIKELLKK